jgi:hemolysin III
MPYNIGVLIIAGVVLYIGGVIFFLWQKWYYHHAIWHAFVLIASACHFTAVLLTVNT